MPFRCLLMWMLTMLLALLSVLEKPTNASVCETAMTEKKGDSKASGAGSDKAKAAQQLPFFDPVELDTIHPFFYAGAQAGWISAKGVELSRYYDPQGSKPLSVVTYNIWSVDFCVFAFVC